MLVKGITVTLAFTVLELTGTIFLSTSVISDCISSILEFWANAVVLMNSKPVIQALGLNDATSFLIETNDVLTLSLSTFLSFCVTKPIRTNNINTCFDHHMDFKVCLGSLYAYFGCIIG